MPLTVDTKARVPEFVCYLCCKKFSTHAALKRHERTSELHRHNLEQQECLLLQHKREVLCRVLALRQQLHEPAVAAVGKARDNVEGQLRKRLGELAQAQEALEQGRPLKGPEAAKTGAFHTARLGDLTLEMGVACWQGSKDTQEDRHVLDIALFAGDSSTEAVVGFCVLDGHCGNRCADFLAENMNGHLQAGLSAQPSVTTENVQKAVVSACKQLDADFLERARKEEMMDGSTMILGLIFKDVGDGKIRLLVANVGDCRGVLCRGHSAGSVGRSSQKQLMAVRMSEDHKPNRPDEQKRIEAKGGLVDFHGVWRVFVPGQVTFGGRTMPRWGLAVSRSFGDLLLKEPERYGCPQVTPGGLVLADPELQVEVIDPATDRFAILACDGVWDVLRDQDAVSVCASQAGVELAAYSLARHSFAIGSGDNITALVVTWRAET